MVSNPLTDPEWADRTVDFIDRVVSTVRRYTTQPLVTTARGLVFGLLGTFGIVGILVLLIVGVTRGLQAALDSVVNHDASVWISYFILSAVFAVIGFILMRRRYTEEDK
jgi:small-conductance mechanosensitive channel